MSQLTAKGVKAIKDIVDKTVASSYPGISLAITNSKGDDLLTYAAGTIGVSSEEPLTQENLFWGASTSKIITAIAVLQLVEQGKLNLDDANQLYALCPELENLPLGTRLDDGSIKLSPRKNDITLRHLLSHTSGMGYPGDNAAGDFFKFMNFTLLDAKTERDILPPLQFEPGTSWQYGPGIDWAGFALERTVGMKLGEYIKTFVTGPCGIEQDLTFTLTQEQKSRLAKMNYRDTATDELVEKEHLYSMPILAEEGQDIVHAGGAGTFSRPAEYIKVLAMILNDGVSPHTGKTVLKKETVDLMFVNQIPQWPNFIYEDLKTSGYHDVYPVSGPQGWGISWFLTETPSNFKRGVNTAHWSGMPNIYYWCDKEKDVAGIVYGQVIPFYDKPVVEAWRDTEDAVYDNLIVHGK